MGAHVHPLNPDSNNTCIRCFQRFQPDWQLAGIHFNPGSPQRELDLVPGCAIDLSRASNLGLAITRLLAGEKQLLNLQLSPGILMATLFTFASVFFYSGGINEECGWRGFAQRHLQANYSPLMTNLLLWAFLVVWHIPNDILQYREGGYLLFRIGLYPFITILFGWIYNRTRGSILAPTLFHASMNSMNALQTSIPVTNASSVLLVLFAVFTVFYDRMWKKPLADNPAVYPVGKAA